MRVRGANGNCYRTLATAVLASSIGIYMGFIPYTWFYFDYRLLLKLPPQIWRPVSSFFLTGPKLGIVFDTYFGMDLCDIVRTTYC